MANTKYDYGVIEQCNTQIRNKVSQMEEHANQFKSEVENLISQTWGGTAAQSYDRSAQQLTQVMETQKSQLDGLGRNVAQGATDMQDTDQRGGRTLTIS